MNIKGISQKKENSRADAKTPTLKMNKKANERKACKSKVGLSCPRDFSMSNQRISSFYQTSLDIANEAK